MGEGFRSDAIACLIIDKTRNFKIAPLLLEPVQKIACFSKMIKHAILEVGSRGENKQPIGSHTIWQMRLKLASTHWSTVAVGGSKRGSKVFEFWKLYFFFVGFQISYGNALSLKKKKNTFRDIFRFFAIFSWQYFSYFFFATFWRLFRDILW